MSGFHPNKPYNKLPKLPPRIDLETPRILKVCIEAHKELAKLKIAERLIPNQTVLINCIPLLESQASSAIENIVTTTDELFEHAQNSSIRMSSATKETLQYRQALYKGYLSTCAVKPLPLGDVWRSSLGFVVLQYIFVPYQWMLPHNFLQSN